MSIKAAASEGYRWRLGLIGLIGLGFAAWSLYDGLYAWPRNNEILTTYQAFETQERLDDWPALAQEMGWPTGEPQMKLRSESDIFQQYIFAAVGLALGAFFAFNFVKAGTRWIEADDQGLTTSWGQTVPFSAVTELNKHRWRSKGIAVVRYKQGETLGRLVLDDWKYDRDGTTQIVDKLQGSINPNLVTGDVPPTPEQFAPAASTDSTPSDKT